MYNVLNSGERPFTDKMYYAVQKIIRNNTPEKLKKKEEKINTIVGKLMMVKEMIEVDKPVIFDCVVDKEENCFPMIPSGKPHNQMLLGPQDKEEEISDEGKVLV